MSAKKTVRIPATINWKEVTPEYIQWRAEERRGNAKRKAVLYAEELRVAGYNAEYVKSKSEDWLRTVLQGWDDFERDQLAAIANRR